LEQARTEKQIGASLDAKVLLHTSDPAWTATLSAMNPSASNIQTGVDELRYLFLASQVTLVDERALITALPYHFLGDTVAVGITTADGHKCDRCWNYATSVGQSQAHPLLCDRCETVIKELVQVGEFSEDEST
jgi:isoleucyl-tRNA synthetase